MFVGAAAIDSISIYSIISTMEPIFAETASETMTPELRAQLDATIAALPPAHRRALTKNEPTDS
jgi:DNA-binding GntR family transcriptional regulator